MEPQEPTTPTIKATWDQCQKPTPVKAKIQGAIDFLKSGGITSENEAVFQANGVSHATGYRILRSSNLRTLKMILHVKKRAGVTIKSPGSKFVRWRKS